jgi:serine O-acetyltransferase
VERAGGNFKADLEQHFHSVGSRSTVDRMAAFFEMSLWAIGIFRFGKWAHSFRFFVIRWPLMAFYFVFYKVSQAISGIRISLDSDIGPGLVIHNFGGVIIHGRVGKNCVFVQGSQMISAGDGKGRGHPTLGDSVYVGAGAKILGNVSIGDHARIGANAVVVTDVPKGGVVLPPHSQIIRPVRSVSPHPAASAPLRERVVLLLEETFCRGAKFPVGDSDSMLENGLVDSLGILMLADKLAAQFGFVVQQDELMPENMDSVEAIVGYIRRKGASD